MCMSPRFRKAATRLEARDWEFALQRWERSRGGRTRGHSAGSCLKPSF